MKRIPLLLLLLISISAANAQEFLVKLNPSANVADFVARHGGTLSLVSKDGSVYKWTTTQNRMPSASFDSQVVVIEPNRTITLPENPTLAANRERILKGLADGSFSLSSFEDGLVYPDNPEIKDLANQAQGSDPLLGKAWGIKNIGIEEAWEKLPQGKGIVVAVTDTGVDYNHEDLINSMWRNKGEIAGNGKDDDSNGYVDDIVGWDFAANDNKPYDAILSLIEILTKGGNPGHGTHVSGVIAASMNNSLGTAGVAPQAKIMALRFITEEGKGSTEDAIKALDYATNNGANIINASWGGEKGEEDDTLLKEAIQRAGKKGVLFLVAAGNGRLNAATQKPEGFDNDTDPKAIVPASYDYDNMICVSAIDVDLKLAAFSNWGKRTCKIGAPGVKILSSVPGNRYQDTVIELGPIKATWDGTSMATPYVVGAAAALWSLDKNQTGKEVRAKLFELATATPSLQGKVTTGARLDLHQVK